MQKQGLKTGGQACELQQSTAAYALSTALPKKAAAAAELTAVQVHKLSDNSTPACNAFQLASPLLLPMHL
jgi:hypothetical protein